MKVRDPVLSFAIIIVVEIAFVLLSWKITYFANPYLVINVDNCVSADVARHVATGDGYRTNTLSLYEVALYDKKGWLSDGPPWRNTYRFPLPIASMAALFELFGDNHFTANFLYPSIFHVFSVIALFVLTFYLFQNTTVSFITSIIFITNTGLLFTMLNKSESADIFFFILSLIVFFVWDKRRKDSFFFVLGLVLGFSFLNRFNEGAILFVTYLTVIYFKERLRIKDAGLYLAGFIIPVIPFIVYNMVTLGVPFFSSNSYFQFIDNSIISKYMSPWYKLNYSIDVTRPFSYLLHYPTDFFMKAVYYVKRYTVPDFLRFRGSVWWWLPLGYVLLRRPLDSRTREMGIIFLVTLLLHIILIAPFGLNMRYLQFLFVPIILIVAATVYEWSRDIELSHPYRLSELRQSAVVRHNFLQSSLFMLSVFVILLSLYSYVSWQIFSLITMITIVSAVVGFSKKRPKIILLCSCFTLLISSVLWLKERSTVFDINAQTAEDSSVLKELKDAVSNRQIILTTHPWNTVWFSGRPSIPIPEYPDEIYLLMKKYRLDIKAIYFSHFDVFLRHVNHRIPISLDSYLRLNRFNLSIKGFAHIERPAKGGFLLYRDDSSLTDILNTEAIDFGNNEANSHLVYGFSSASVLGGATVCWVLHDTEVPFDKQEEFRFVEDGKVDEYGTPQAEITFLRDGSKRINHFKLRLFSINAGQAMTVVLNSNLFSYGDKGVFTGTVSLNKGWNLIDLPLKHSGLRPGLNKLSFWFKEQGILASSAGDEIYMKYQQPSGEKQESPGVAFDKAYFGYSERFSRK